MTWGNGYKQGYQEGARKALKLFRADFSEKERNKKIGFLITQISRDDDGSPSQYAVANKCCGGIDAHDVNCRG